MRVPATSFIHPSEAKKSPWLPPLKRRQMCRKILPNGFYSILKTPAKSNYIGKRPEHVFTKVRNLECCFKAMAVTITDLNKNYTKGRSCNYKTFPRSTARKTVALCPKTTYKVQEFLFTFWILMGAITEIRVHIFTKRTNIVTSQIGTKCLHYESQGGSADLSRQ